MKAVTSAFDKDTDSQEKLEAQTRILNEQIKVQDQRIELLQKGVEAASDKFEKGATQTLKWEQALNEAKSTLNGLKSNLSNLENGVEDVTEELKDGEQASFGFGDALKSDLLSGTIIEGVKGLAGSLSDLTESTKEYRKIMASLDISSENAGYTAEETTEIYKTLYGVLGDNQTAATTTANLQAIGLEQEQLTEITNGAIGAWATYGDSIPIDGLAESINETIQAGTVTGTFADVLNWAGTSEDDFNKKLSEAKDSTERANIVLDELAKQGLPDAGKAWQDANDDIVDANKATSDFEDITADLSKKFSPISTSLQEGFNEIAEAALDMVDDSDIDEFSDIISDVADFIADEVMPVIKNLFDFVIDNGDTILRVVEGIGVGFATWKSAEVVSKVSGKLGELAEKGGKAAGPMKILNGLWKENPAAVVATSVGLLTTAIELFADSLTAPTEQEMIFQERLNDRKEILEELSGSYNSVKTAAYDQAQAEVAQLDAVQLLYDELTTLADETGKVTDKDRDRANFILSELNKALGTEYTMTGNQIQQYQIMRGEIEDLIKVKKAQAYLTASEEAYQAALKDTAEMERQSAQQKKDLQELQKQLEKEYGENWNNRAIMVQSLGAIEAYEYTRKMDLLQEEGKTYQEYQAKLQKMYQDRAVYEEASTAFLAGETQKTIDLLSDQVNGFISANSLISESETERNRILKDQYENSLIALEDYKKNYLQGIKGYTEEGLKEHEEYTKKCKKEMEEGGKKAGQAYLNSLLNENTNFENASLLGHRAGEDTVLGYSNGINESTGLVISAGQNLANKLISVVKNNLGIRSPSRVMKELGMYTGEGFEIGLDESMKDAVATLQRDLDASAAVLSNVQPFSVPVGFGNPMFSSSAGRSVTYGDFSIVVNAAPGMDENALADAVAYKLQTQVMQKEAVFR